MSHDPTPPSEDIFSMLRATRTTHPAAASRTASPSDFTSVQLPMSGGSNGGDGHGNGRGSGAVLSDAEVAELAGQRAASNVSATDVRSEIAALEKRMAYVRAELQGGRRGPTETAGFQKELESLNESRLVAELTLQRVAERDAARRAKALKDDEIAAAEHEFINGDPKRREAYERAKLDYEARTFAEWVTLKKLGH